MSPIRQIRQRFTLLVRTPSARLEDVPPLETGPRVGFLM